LHERSSEPSSVLAVNHDLAEAVAGRAGLEPTFAGDGDRDRLEPVAVDRGQNLRGAADRDLVLRGLAAVHQGEALLGHGPGESTKPAAEGQKRRDLGAAQLSTVGLFARVAWLAGFFSHDPVSREPSDDGLREPPTALVPLANYPRATGTRLELAGDRSYSQRLRHLGGVVDFEVTWVRGCVADPADRESSDVGLGSPPLRLGSLADCLAAGGRKTGDFIFAFELPTEAAAYSLVRYASH